MCTALRLIFIPERSRRCLVKGKSQLCTCIFFLQAIKTTGYFSFIWTFILKWLFVSNWKISLVQGKQCLYLSFWTQNINHYFLQSLIGPTSLEMLHIETPRQQKRHYINHSFSLFLLLTSLKSNFQGIQ